MAIHEADNEYGASRHSPMIALLADSPVGVENIPEPRQVPHRKTESELVERVKSILQTIAR